MSTWTYQIITHDDQGCFELDVSKALNDGFQLWGSLVLSGPYFYQAMVKEDKIARPQRPVVGTGPK